MTYHRTRFTPAFSFSAPSFRAISHSLALYAAMMAFAAPASGCSLASREAAPVENTPTPSTPSAPATTPALTQAARTQTIHSGSTNARGTNTQSANTQPNAETPTADSRMRIITIESTLEVAHTARALRNIRALVEELGGYVESSDIANENAYFASIVARVPKAKLREFRTGQSRLGELAREQERSEDITNQYVDLDARMRNAQREEERLLDLLEHRTGALADILTVERELARVRETVEGMQAQLRGMASQVEFVKVSIALQSPVPAYTAPTDLERITESFKEGIACARWFVVGLTQLILTAGPTLLILALLFAPVLWWAVRKVRKTFFPKRTKAGPNENATAAE